MKVTKDNCRATCSYSGECHLYMDPDLTGKPKVFEVPKVWREDGKQYKVTVFHGPGISYHHVIKAPRGCHVSAFGDYDIEYYD